MFCVCSRIVTLNRKCMALLYNGVLKSDDFAEYRALWKERRTVTQAPGTAVSRPDPLPSAVIKIEMCDYCASWQRAWFITAQGIWGRGRYPDSYSRLTADWWLGQWNHWENHDLSTCCELPE